MGMYPTLFIVGLTIAAVGECIAGFTLLSEGGIAGLIAGGVLACWALAGVSYIVIWFISPFREADGGYAYNKIDCFNSCLVLFLGPFGLIPTIAMLFDEEHRAVDVPKMDINAMRKQQAHNIAAAEAKNHVKKGAAPGQVSIEVRESV